MARLDTRALPFDAAIVDLDGTMVDTLGDFAVALNAMLAELGQPPITREAIERRVGRGSEHLIHSVLGAVGAPPDLYEAAWASYQFHYRAINGQHSCLYEGVARGLDALRAAGMRLACLTNKPRDFARPLLESKQIAGYFEVVFGGDDFERKKPDPMPLLGTCAAMGVDPARALMIGDSSNDARAARAAGCAVVLVTYGYNHGEPVRRVDADGFVDSLADIGAWLATQAAFSPSRASFKR
jgi:phosphoglycolate phosphatase